MTDIPSVLLIVGSVLVGPIDAQPTGPNAAEYERSWESVQCIRREIDAGRAERATQAMDKCGPFNLIGMQLETTDQLCERAMREIGALNDGRWYMPPQTRDEQLSPQFVRCIATPKGYWR